MVFLPTQGSLPPKFQGPYQVMKRFESNDYLVSTPDRRKKTQKFHINLLNKYYEREEEDGSKIVYCLNSTNHVNDCNQNYLPELPLTSPGMKNSEVLDNFDSLLPHVSPEEKRDVMNTLRQFKRVTSDL